MSAFVRRKRPLPLREARLQAVICRPKTRRASAAGGIVNQLLCQLDGVEAFVGARACCVQPAGSHRSALGGPDASTSCLLLDSSSTDILASSSSSSACRRSQRRVNGSSSSSSSSSSLSASKLCLRWHGGDVTLGSAAAASGVAERRRRRKRRCSIGKYRPLSAAHTTQLFGHATRDCRWLRALLISVCGDICGGGHFRSRVVASLHLRLESGKRVGSNLGIQCLNLAHSQTSFDFPSFQSGSGGWRPLSLENRPPQILSPQTQTACELHVGKWKESDGLFPMGVSFSRLYVGIVSESHGASRRTGFSHVPPGLISRLSVIDYRGSVVTTLPAYLRKDGKSMLACPGTWRLTSE